MMMLLTGTLPTFSAMMIITLMVMTLDLIPMTLTQVMITGMPGLVIPTIAHQAKQPEGLSIISRMNFEEIVQGSEFYQASNFRRIVQEIYMIIVVITP